METREDTATSEGSAEPERVIIATNRFDLLSTAAVRKGRLLECPAARDLSRLTERMTISHNSRPAARGAVASLPAHHRGGGDDTDESPTSSTSYQDAPGPSPQLPSQDRLRRAEALCMGTKAQLRHRKANAAVVSPSHKELQNKYTHLIVIDFEATCDSAEPDYPHEIIEFPAVAVDLATMKVVSEFGSFARPVRNPTLTEFCTTLTGIRQEDVDAAPLLADVIVMFTAWLDTLRDGYAHAQATTTTSSTMNASNIGDDSETTRTTEGTSLSAAPAAPDVVAITTAGYNDSDLPPPTATTPATPHTTTQDAFRPIIATDGPWDMRKFMHECSVVREGIPFPELFYTWIDIRKAFSNFNHKPLMKLTKMLRALGMSFIGERHRGIDDSRNIARVAMALGRRGYRFNQVCSIPFRPEGSALIQHEREAMALVMELEADGPLRVNKKTSNNKKGSQQPSSAKKSKRK